MSGRDTIPERWFQVPQPEWMSCIRCGVRIRRDADTGYCKQCVLVPHVQQAGDPTWMEHGLCTQVDPELWYPDKGSSAATIAKAICNGDGGRDPCPVREQCLTYALERNERIGIWGGLAPKERRTLRRAA